MTTDRDPPLVLFNSLTRQAEPFHPVREGEARVYTCGPTVYNYPHIGNMRAYVFADVLGRTLSFCGYQLTHVINITDVGHLTDDADAIAQKIRKAKTDPAPLPDDIEGLAGRPEADNLVGIFAALSGKSKADVIAEYGGQGFGAFKPALADLTVSVMGSISARMREYLDDPGELDAVLMKGALKARSVAVPILAETKKLVGFWRA